MLLLALRGTGFSELRQPVIPWIVAVGAIFSYYALYFYALATVPPAHASLIAYFWPLLIVIFSAFGPTSSGLSWKHFAGGSPRSLQTTAQCL
jgi:drug/metabolite transporter (DMT)-like permease